MGGWIPVLLRLLGLEAGAVEADVDRFVCGTPGTRPRVNGTAGLRAWVGGTAGTRPRINGTAGLRRCTCSR